MWADRVEPNPGVLGITVFLQVVGRGEDGDAVLAHPLGHAELRLDAGHEGAIPQWLSRIKQLHTAMERHLLVTILACHLNAIGSLKGRLHQAAPCVNHEARLVR